MASLAPPEKYSDDAGRIDEDYIPDRATTEDEIDAALDAAEFPEDAQSHIKDWLVTESEAWDVVDAQTQDAGSVETAIRSESGGTVSDGRASSMADSIASDINAARAEAAQRIGDDGMIRTEDGRVIGKPSTVEEEVREDGIYYRNTETGTEGRAARFPNGGSR
jgi:hypothetical protein